MPVGQNRNGPDGNLTKPSPSVQTFVDFRSGRPVEVDCTKLAFVDSAGKPIYRVRDNGDQYDKITEAWRELKRKHPSAPQYRSIRKATNNTLCELLCSRVADDDTEGLIAVSEISKQFLAEKTDTLARLYKTTGPRLYDRMNRYLSEVGDHFRTRGVFDCLRTAGRQTQTGAKSKKPRAAGRPSWRLPAGGLCQSF